MSEVILKEEAIEPSQRKKRNIKKIVLFSVIAFVIISCVVTMIVTIVTMKQFFGRVEYTEPRFSANYRYDHYKADYPAEEVSFKSGENTLKGRIYGADNEKGLIVVAHGIGGGHENYINEIIWFVDNGWKVFAYDATGSCESEGDGTKGLVQSALDLDCALSFAEGDERFAGLPVFLFGHSWGGYAVTAVLNFDHDIAGSASIAGYAEPMEMLTEFAEGMMGKAAYAVYPFMWIYNKAEFGKYSDLSAVEGINKNDTPVLIIHGTGDDMVGYDRSSIICKKDMITNPNVQYITYSDEGHNGHDSIFHTKEAMEYIDEFNEKYDKLYNKYDGEIPDDEKAAFYAAADKEKVNAVNEDMMTSINAFYEEQLEQIS